MRLTTLVVPALLLGATLALPIAAAERCNPGQFINFPHDCLRQDPTLGGPFRRAEALVDDAEALVGEAPGIVMGAVDDALAEANDAAQTAGALANGARTTAEETVAGARDAALRRADELAPEECPLVRPITPSQTLDDAIRAAIAQLPSAAGRSQAEATYEDVQHLDWWCAEQLDRV